MAPRSFTSDRFEALRREEGWSRIKQFPAIAAAGSYLTATTTQWTRGSATQRAIADVLAQSGSLGNALRADQIVVAVDRLQGQGALSLLTLANSTVHVWTFDVEASDAFEGLRRMAALARNGRADCGLELAPQEDRSFMWRGSLIHPMQVRENVFQRVVHAVDHDASIEDPLAAKSEALGRYFQQGEAPASPLDHHRADAAAAQRWASVRMNHLIDTFYLFRLLVRYQASAADEVGDDLRIELSSALTKILHSGDAARMGWLTQWLAEKVADLGRRVDALNRGAEKKVIFFLKGGRALNYYLGTPSKGENDWDTQVVIDPRLPAEEWYALLSQVHDILLEALEQYADEFTRELEGHAADFGDYLESLERPPALDEDEVAVNDLEDVGSRVGRAGCKAELIDIGLPRRGTPAALEEWNHLSPEGAILEVGGVRFPHRPYYVNEYLMMVREAFRPKADVHKAPKRVARLALLLSSQGGDFEADRKRVSAVLPRMAAAIDAVASRACREVLTTTAAQFAQAYSLTQDKGFAGVVDGWGEKLVVDPPALSTEFAQALERLGDDEQQLARAVGVAHALAGKLERHSEHRSQFVLKHAPLFESLLLGIRTQVEPQLGEVSAQLAVVGAFAARQHAAQLRLSDLGLEPVRRVVAHLQHPAATPEKDVLERVKQDVLAQVAHRPELELIGQGPEDDVKGRTLSFQWSEEVTFEDGASYKPLVFKVRAAAQVGDRGALPVLSSIRGLPVLDMRFLADDYLRKSAKTHEVGMQAILQKASQAIVELMSQFEVTTVEQVDPDDAV